MKNFKRIMIAVLALVFVFSLSSCGSKSVVGTWEAEIDLGDILSTQLEAALGSKIDDIEFKAVLTFVFEEKEATLKLEAKDSAEEIKDMMLELSYEVIKNQGLEMSYEDFLSALKSTGTDKQLDDQAKQVVESLEVEESDDYTYEDGVIKLGNGSTLEIELSSGSFKIVKMTVEQSDDEEEAILGEELIDVLEGTEFKKVD